MARKKRRVTLQDVAREAGVSPMTVSRVINNTGRISPETRAYIREVIARMGYRPSRIARSLATNKTFMIGLVVPDITNPYFAEIVEGAENAAWEKSYSVLLANTSENPAREQAVLEQLEESMVDGVIVCSSRLPDEKLLPLIERHKAVVSVNRPVPPHLASVIDFDPTGIRRWKTAVLHLIRSGYRRIAYLFLQRSLVQGTLEEYLAVMHDAGLEANPEWYAGSTPTWESGYQVATKLLTAYPELDAIVGGNDLVALGAMRAAFELGKRVPDDLAIIGGDDILMAREVKPSLTTFRAPKHAIGATAARLLFKRIEGNTAYEEFFYTEELIIRESAP